MRVPDIPVTRTDVTELTSVESEIFSSVCRAWDLTESETIALHGSFSALGHKEAKDQITGTRRVIFIYRALHTAYGALLANAWMKLKNSNPMFNGSTPLQFICEGGPPALESLCRLLAARIS